MELVVKEAKTRAELKRFVQFAGNLYKDNPYWVPLPFQAEMKLLSKNKNPSFDFCEAKYFLAYRSEKIVGRVAAILNHAHEEKWGQKYLRFGWLEFVDDPQVSAALMGAVQNWAIEKRITAIHGPLGFTDFDRSGLLVEGFNEMGTMMANYSQPYYPRHLEKLGYKKDIDWLEYLIEVPEKLDKEIADRAEQILKNNHLRIFKAENKKEYLRYTDQLFDLINESYQNRYGFVPLNQEQLQVYMDSFYPLVNHKFIALIVDENDELAAFSITNPSLSKALQSGGGRLFPNGFFNLIRSKNANDRAELLLHGVKEKYSGIGMSVVMMIAMLQNFHEFGIKTVESNPELENDQNVQIQWRVFEKRQHKRRRCYIKRLTNE